MPHDLKENPDKYPGMSMDKWRPNHGPAQTRPALDATIEYLRDNKGISKLAAVGYCFGGAFIRPQ